MNPVPYEEIKGLVTAALDDFQRCDLQLLELCVDERAATHRIACYLQKYFTGWNVDCEYNRKGTGRKLSPVPNSTGRVKPDIIIHKRNVDDNLLCVEAKKKGGASRQDIQNDRDRLLGFTSANGDYKYQYGLLLVLSSKIPYSIDCEWFCAGKPFEKNRFPLM